ncbi:MAG TPA: hypothetical protein VEZ41_02625 [Allosphingosinicella sp.]|nr:hypothetical protein [Allosphingosinicella sp.]
MATLIFAMDQSLDGYVDHGATAPSPALFRHWIENQRGLAGSIYGRPMQESMRYCVSSLGLDCDQDCGRVALSGD